MSDEPGIFEIIYSTRAMRRLKTDPVPEGLLRRLIDAANQAPSGSNAQNQRWIIVHETGQKQKLAELNRAAVERYLAVQRANASPVSGPTRTPDGRERLRSAVQWQADHMQEIPALIIACLEFTRPPNDSFSAGAGAAGSIWPAVQNLLLAARALGLGATPTTLGLSDRPAARAVLGLPDTIEPFCLIPVGYPMGRFGPVTRRPVDEVLRWDRWR